MTDHKEPIIINMNMSHDGWFRSVETLCLGDRYYSVGSMPRGQEGREYNGGPMEPGPFAWTNQHATVICSDPSRSTGAEMKRKREAGLVVDVEGGDEIIVDEALYRVRIERREYINLELIADLRDPYEDTARIVARNGFGGNAWEPLPEDTTDEVRERIKEDPEAFKRRVYHYLETEVVPGFELDKFSAGEKRTMLYALLTDPDVDCVVSHGDTVDDVDKESVCFNGPSVQVSM